MRFSGAVLLWIAFTLIGMRISLLLKNRQQLIEETLSFFNFVITEIEYSRTNIVKIVRLISEEDSLKKLSFIKNCAIEIEKGADFPSAWQKAVESSRLYKSEEKDKLLHLGRFLGTSDTENQINTLKIYSSFFDKYYDTATEDYNRYGKVSSLFGLFIGAAIFILLF